MEAKKPAKPKPNCIPSLSAIALGPIGGMCGEMSASHSEFLLCVVALLPELTRPGLGYPGFVTDELVNESRRECLQLIHTEENGENDMMGDVGKIRRPAMRKIFAERTPVCIFFNVRFGL